VVVIFHDHGTRYLGKMYNPDWMREKGFLDRKGSRRATWWSIARRRRTSSPRMPIRKTP